MTCDIIAYLTSHFGFVFEEYLGGKITLIIMTWLLSPSTLKCIVEVYKLLQFEDHFYKSFIFMMN